MAGPAGAETRKRVGAQPAGTRLPVGRLADESSQSVRDLGRKLRLLDEQVRQTAVPVGCTPQFNGCATARRLTSERNVSRKKGSRIGCPNRHEAGESSTCLF